MLWPRLAPDDVSVYVCVGWREEGGGTHQPKPPRGTSWLCQRVTWVMSDACFFFSQCKLGKCEFHDTHTHKSSCQRVCSGLCGILRAPLIGPSAGCWLLAAAAAGEGVSQWGESIDTTKVQIKNLLMVLWVPNGFLRWGACEELVVRYTYINITNDLVIHKYYEGFCCEHIHPLAQAEWKVDVQNPQKPRCRIAKAA